MPESSVENKVGHWPASWICATAVERSLTLCTGNAKHFKVINDLELNVFRP